MRWQLKKTTNSKKNFKFVKNLSRHKTDVGPIVSKH